MEEYFSFQAMSVDIEHGGAGLFSFCRYEVSLESEVTHEEERIDDEAQSQVDIVFFDIVFQLQLMPRPPGSIFLTRVFIDNMLKDIEDIIGFYE